MDKTTILPLLINQKNIIGILSTSQPVKLGKTKGGKNIYQIKPIKKIFPPFWITYGGKLTGKLIINFKFKEWSHDDKLPFGEIIEVIGILNDSLLTKTLILHHQIDRKKFKNNLKVNENESNIIRKNLSHLEIFSIDPPGCIDIDDALSIHEENDLIIGVHIAQPICWLEKDEIIERANIAISTIYCEDNKNLWSDEITEKASLFKSQEKPAYSIMFYYKDNKLIKTESFPSTIINKINTDYDNINFEVIQKLLEFTKKLLNKDIDSHELVSFWMIEANNYIGNNFDGIPIRCQDDKINYEINITDSKINQIFNNTLIEGAYYSYEKNFHKSLDKHYYTHFTSPIRRIIDTIIHWNITYNDEIKLELDKINIIDKKTKKFHQEMNLLEKINKLPDFVETMGWIYNKNDNKWIVYFEELGFIKVKIWDKKLDYLKEIKDDEYKIGDKYHFEIKRKIGFLPKEKILINLKPR